MAKSRMSVQPSPYPSVVFHAIRAGQVISSVIVIGILGFFIYHLSLELYQIPWTFILLLAVSCSTLLFIIVTAYFYHRRIIYPKLSLVLNIFLGLIWAVGAGLLTWYLSPLLGNSCDIAIWKVDVAVLVCQLYKALTAFAIIGFVFTFLGLVLDVYTVRSSRHRGSYNPMAEAKISHPRSASTDRLNARGPSLEYPEYSHEVKQPYKAARPIESQQFDYSAPAEQTSYDGAAGASHLGGGGHTYAGDGYGA